ncbi:hypothetical protein L7F22_006652 [Adiantum nelumboides]|nr:hypothetical protein [Adiantum nelumboides]
MNCAEFVAMGDLKKASEIVQKLYHVHGASAKGNGLQRTTHFFYEALLSRMGGQRDETLSENTLSVASFIRSGRIWYEVAPYSKVMHYFANQTILKATKGASRLHVLNHAMFFGMQWPCLINALADREGGLPLLVMTGIDCSKPGLNSLEWLEEGGRCLAAYARTYNVPFQFHGVVSNPWEDVVPASLHLQESEVLLINLRSCTTCDLRWLWCSCDRIQKLELSNCDGTRAAGSKASQVLGTDWKVADLAAPDEDDPSAPAKLATDFNRFQSIYLIGRSDIFAQVGAASGGAETSSTSDIANSDVVAWETLLQQLVAKHMITIVCISKDRRRVYTSAAAEPALAAAATMLVHVKDDAFLAMFIDKLTEVCKDWLVARRNQGGDCSQDCYLVGHA